MVELAFWRARLACPLLLWLAGAFLASRLPSICTLLPYRWNRDTRGPNMARRVDSRLSEPFYPLYERLAAATCCALDVRLLGSGGLPAFSLPELLREILSTVWKEKAKKFLVKQPFLYGLLFMRAFIVYFLAGRYTAILSHHGNSSHCGARMAAQRFRRRLPRNLTPLRENIKPLHSSDGV